MSPRRAPRSATGASAHRRGRSGFGWGRRSRLRPLSLPITPGGRDAICRHRSIHARWSANSDMVPFRCGRPSRRQPDDDSTSLDSPFAAELAVFCPQHVRRLVLVAPFGLWLEEAPIPDFFAMSPGQLQRATWHDPESPQVQEALGRLVNGASGLQATIRRASNLASAGKFLWPIPDRGLSKRLHLIKAPTLVVLGASDRLITGPYGDAFVRAIPDARLIVIPDAGHAPMLERPEAFLAAVEGFLSA